MKTNKMLLLLALPFLVACGSTSTSASSSTQANTSTSSSVANEESSVDIDAVIEKLGLNTYEYQGASFPSAEVKAFLEIECTVPACGGSYFYGDEVNSMVSGNYYDVAVVGYTQKDIADYFAVFQSNEEFEVSTGTQDGIKFYNAVGEYQVIMYEYSNVFFIEYYKTVQYTEYDHFPLAEAQEYLGITDVIPAVAGNKFLGLATYVQSTSSYYNVFEILVENPSSTLREEYAATVAEAGFTCSQDGTTYQFETENAICLFDYQDNYFILDIYVPYVYEGTSIPNTDINNAIKTSLNLPSFEGEHEYSGYILADSYGDTYYQVIVQFEDDSCVETYAQLMTAAGYNPTKEHNSTNDIDFYYESTNSYYYQFYYNTTYSVFVLSIWGA